MKKILLLIPLLWYCPLMAQPDGSGDCAPSNAKTFLHANDIRAMISHSGTLFFDGNDANFEVPFGNGTHTIFTQGLWMGGIDPGGNLKVAAQTYGFPNANDYWAGPIDEETGTTEATTCEHWDQIWCVWDYQINSHIADFQADNDIDNPIEALMKWPGMGNPHFEALHGFALPAASQGLAPFYDVNGDDIYDPLDGDYPIVEQSEVMPAQICWQVYNDAGNIHTVSDGNPVQMEIQLTNWAFNCADNPQLNQSIFASYTFINRAVESIDSFRVGFFHDFDLGCYTDDYIGHYPDHHTVFVYNQDPVDGEGEGACFNDVLSYQGTPPVQSATFLNKPLDYGMYFLGGTIDGPVGTMAPQSPLEYYYYLSGRWRDGTPLTEGGSGYDPSITNPVTNIVFPGDPNNPDEWSAFSENLFAGDRRVLSSTEIGLLEPGSSTTLDVAYTFFPGDDDGTWWLSTVTNMYEGVEVLSEWYASKFIDACTPVAPCEEDCIWAGDLNADGIANYCDLIPLGQALGTDGGTRPSPYNWAPQNGESWGAAQSNGADLKHIDANGDGLASIQDFDLSMLHYGLTNPTYEPSFTVIPSEEQGLYAVPSVSGAFDDAQAGDLIFARIGIEGYEPLKALAFSMKYDPLYIERVDVFFNTFDEELVQYTDHHGGLHEVHFARYALNEEDYISQESFVNIAIKIRDELDETELPADYTMLQFGNTKGVNSEGEELVIESLNTAITFIGVMVSVEEAVANDHASISLFPNPAKAQISVNSKVAFTAPSELYAITGQHIRKISLKGSGLETLSLEGMTKGVYLLKLYTSDGIEIHRFVKD
jgi:hypothetical protein